jgi:undecaprenyl-diphosphatase
MTMLQAIILGIIQGLTEFLPISSSAHLVITPFLLGWQIPPEQSFPFNVLVQIGTLLAVIVYFWKDLWGIAVAFVRGLLERRPFADPQSRLGWQLILATVPAGLLALFSKDQVEAAFQSPAAVGGFLLVTAVLLVGAERIGKRSRTLAHFGWQDALWMGMAQGMALLPGISRSGATIAGGMTRNLDRPSAARFSFLMSVPVMVIAGLFTSLDLLAVPNLSSFLPSMATGFLTAAIVGYLSIRWLLSYLVRHSMDVFAAYCAVLGLLTLAIYFIRG